MSLHMSAQLNGFYKQEQSLCTPVEVHPQQYGILVVALCDIFPVLELVLSNSLDLSPYLPYTPLFDQTFVNSHKPNKK